MSILNWSLRFYQCFNVMLTDSSAFLYISYDNNNNQVPKKYNLGACVYIQEYQVNSTMLYTHKDTYMSAARAQGVLILVKKQNKMNLMYSTHISI